VKSNDVNDSFSTCLDSITKCIKFQAANLSDVGAPDPSESDANNMS
jgi:hypothetical protein